MEEKEKFIRYSDTKTEEIFYLKYTKEELKLAKNGLEITSSIKTELAVKNYKFWRRLINFITFNKFYKLEINVNVKHNLNTNSDIKNGK